MGDAICVCLERERERVWYWFPMVTVHYGDQSHLHFWPVTPFLYAYTSRDLSLTSWRHVYMILLLSSIYIYFLSSSHDKTINIFQITKKHTYIGEVIYSRFSIGFDCWEWEKIAERKQNNKWSMGEWQWPRIWRQTYTILTERCVKL